jgi:hypothetical protein
MLAHSRHHAEMYAIHWNTQPIKNKASRKLVEHVPFNHLISYVN